VSGASFKRVRSGDKLTVPADAWNAMLDAAEANMHRQFGGEPPVPPSRKTVKIYNDSGSDADQLDVLGVDEPLIFPDDNLAEFKRQVLLSCSTPAAGTHEGKFVILAEPIPDGAIGDAWAFGVRPVLIDVADPDHEYAEIDDGETDHLTTAAAGSAQVLWRESGSTGEKYALIRFGNTPLEPGDDYPGEWYWFSADYNDIAQGNTGRLITNGGYGGTIQFYPEFEVAGKVTGCRAVAPDTITAGSLTIYPAKGSQADTRADGDVDNWTDGTDSLVLSAGVSSNRATNWTQLAIAAGEALGGKIVVSADFEPEYLDGILIGFRFTPD